MKPEPLVSPVIMIGMHRSGTSLISRVLGELGVNMGKKTEMNDESTLFQGLNDWMLSQSGASWDNPCSIELLLNNPEIRLAVEEYLRNMLNSPRVISHIGLAKYIRYNSLWNLPTSWGWKDPRNTFTLPIWLDLFPNAKVVHVYRHGLDVSNSLLVRHHKLSKSRINKYLKFKKLYWLRPKRTGFSDTLRCASVSGGVALWREYMSEAKKHVSQYRERVHEIMYEEFLRDPKPIVRQLAQFCGEDASDTTIDHIVSKLIGTRAYAYRNNKDSSDWECMFAEQLKEFGY